MKIRCKFYRKMIKGYEYSPHDEMVLGCYFEKGRHAMIDWAGPDFYRSYSLHFMLWCYAGEITLLTYRPLP
jgi:hypothetical protein